MKVRTPKIMRYPYGNQVTVPETQEKQFAGVTTFLRLEYWGHRTDDCEY